MDIALEMVGLDVDVKTLSSPGVRCRYVDEEPLSSEDSTLYRAVVARLKYLSQDRSDFQFSVRELCHNVESKTRRLGCVEAFM